MPERAARPVSGAVGDRMGLSGVGAGLSLIARIGAVGGCCLALAHCGGPVSSKIDPKYGVSASPRVVQFGEPVPKGGGTYRVGKPYVVGGRTYSPEENADYSAEGIASWYGEDFHGRQTANGEVYDMQSISAAHPTLPIPSYARVTNLANQRSIIVRVNDRGPYHAGPSDRRVGAHRAAARLPGQRHRPRAGGLCRPRFARGLRRHQARGHASSRHAGAGPAEIRLAASRPSAAIRIIGGPRRRADARRAAVRTRATIRRRPRRQARERASELRRGRACPDRDRWLQPVPASRLRRAARPRAGECDRASTPGLRRPAMPAVPLRRAAPSRYRPMPRRFRAVARAR